jgi:hypothetical protein
MIGTLNEGALHAELKEWYRRPRDRAEEKVDGYVVDLVRGRLLIEIQTGNFAPLRRKLDALLRTHRVRLVAPVALSRRIVRLSDDGVVLSSRRSPRHGRLEDVFARLVASRLSRTISSSSKVACTPDEMRMFSPAAPIVAAVGGRRRSLHDSRGPATIACRRTRRSLPVSLPASPDTAGLRLRPGSTGASRSRWLTACACQRSKLNRPASRAVYRWQWKFGRTGCP